MSAGSLNHTRNGENMREPMLHRIKASWPTSSKADCIRLLEAAELDLTPSAALKMNDDETRWPDKNDDLTKRLKPTILVPPLF